MEPHFQTDEGALDQRLQNVPDVQDPEEAPVWLVGDHFSIADLSFLTWANVVDRIGIDLETEFPVQRNLLTFASDGHRRFKSGLNI